MIDPNFFGAPNTGMHAYRFLNIAIVDVGTTALGAKILANMYDWDFKKTFAGSVLLGVAVHKIVGVKTGLNGMLGLN